MSPVKKKIIGFITIIAIGIATISFYQFKKATDTGKLTPQEWSKKYK